MGKRSANILIYHCKSLADCIFLRMISNVLEISTITDGTILRRVRNPCFITAISRQFESCRFWSLNQPIIEMRRASGEGTKIELSGMIFNCLAIITLAFIGKSVQPEALLRCLCCGTEIAQWARHGAMFGCTRSTAQICQEHNFPLDSKHNWSIMGLSDLVIGLSVSQSGHLWFWRSNVQYIRFTSFS